MRQCKKHELLYETKKCPRCKAEASKKYNEKYPEKKREAYKRWCVKNPDKLKLYAAARVASGANARAVRNWSVKNKEKKAAYFLEHKNALLMKAVINRLEEPNKNKEACSRYRAKKKSEQTP